MVEIDVLEEEQEDALHVPVEATAFLAAVSVFAILLLVLFLYVNNKWRFLNLGRPYSTKHNRADPSTKCRVSPYNRPPVGGDSYVLSPESSSDSEEDVLRRIRHQMALQQFQQQQQQHLLVSRGSPSQTLLTTAIRSLSVDQPTYHPRLTQQRSFDLPYHPLHQSTPASNNNVNFNVANTPHQQVPSSSSCSSAGYASMRPLRLSKESKGDSFDDGASSVRSGSRRRPKGLMGASSLSRCGGGDLMSLAEKGKVNGGSSASSTSSNGSTDDDPMKHQHHNQSQTVIMRQHPIRVDNNNPHRSASRSSSIATTLISNTLPQSSPPPRTNNHNLNNHTSSAPTGFRRMMMPPRTKSIDSESPPPSEPGLSTYGDSIVDQDDHIFEVEELPLDIPRANSISSPINCGSVEVSFDYEAAPRKMTVHVIQARGVPPKDVGGANNTQIRLVLLPDRRQKHKTKVRPGENPSFIETFVFSKVNPEDVSNLAIRFRLYGSERMRRERLLGEVILHFGSLHLEMETTMWLNFEPKYHLSWDSKSETRSLARSDSASSTGSVQGGIPELLVGLAYNGTTGRLTVEITKGSHFRQLAGGRAPDSYIKLVLVSCTGQEMGRAKTSLRRAQSNPLFKETFMFQVALFQVQEVTLLVSVYGRKGVTRRELLGWFALGQNASGEEEATHWEDMCDGQGDQMCRWHILQTN